MESARLPALLGPNRGDGDIAVERAVAAEIEPKDTYEKQPEEWHAVRELSAELHFVAADPQLGGG